MKARYLPHHNRLGGGKPSGWEGGERVATYSARNCPRVCDIVAVRSGGLRGINLCGGALALERAH